VPLFFWSDDEKEDCGRDAKVSQSEQAQVPSNEANEGLQDGRRVRQGL
jgi:hypothetical protein